MDSHITVADAKTALSRFAYSDAEFLRKLNRSCEHYLNSDVYVDLFSIVRFPGANGYITVPRQYGRIVGVIDSDIPQGISPASVEWKEFGIGRQDPASMDLRGLIESQENVCTHFDALDAEGNQQAGVLKAVLEVSGDAGKKVRIFGNDENGRRVFDSTGNLGIELVLASPNVSTTQQFTDIVGIQIESGVKGHWQLYKTVSGTDVLLSNYEPGETRPRYVRYKTRTTTEPIWTYCRRKPVNVVADTDWVFPANLDALEHGFNALTYRDKGSFKTEEECWTQGKKVLIEEYRSLHPGVNTYLIGDGFGLPRRNGVSAVRGW